MIRHINLNKPGGCQLTVYKEECVCHLAKCFYKHLMNACKAKLVDDQGEKVNFKGKYGLILIP